VGIDVAGDVAVGFSGALGSREGSVAVVREGLCSGSVVAVEVLQLKIFENRDMLVVGIVCVLSQWSLFFFVYIPLTNPKTEGCALTQPVHFQLQIRPNQLSFCRHRIL